MSDGKNIAFLGYIKSKKSLFLIVTALILGLIMMIFGDGFGNSEDDSGQNEDITELEKRVEALCERVEGVGNATVMITLDTTGEQVYARNSRVFGSGESSESLHEYVTASGGLVPTESKLSRIRGIAVVCTGGGDAFVRLTLTELLCSLFDISSGSVYIACSK